MGTDLKSKVSGLRAHRQVFMGFASKRCRVLLFGSGLVLAVCIIVATMSHSDQLFLRGKTGTDLNWRAPGQPTTEVQWRGIFCCELVSGAANAVAKLKLTMG